MDKTFFLYIVVGLSIAYVIITNVKDIQAEDERYQNNSYQREHQYDKYYQVDSMGDKILVIENPDINLQKKVWNNSKIKEETMELFPMFEEMKTFIKLRVDTEPLKTEILKQITNTEEDYISGTINYEQTKRQILKL